MIALELRFLTGRFHGNGWHSAHNEGVPEWPPSPWRILRALVSAAYAEDLRPTEVEPLLEKLRSLPRYKLPLAVDAHTRHYVPETRAKLFDAFVAVEGGARAPAALTVSWEVDLSGAEKALLSRLSRRVSYLGRAESWAELRVLEGTQGANCWPSEHDLAQASTNLLALSTASDFAHWTSTQSKPKKGSDIPRCLWDVLTFSGDRYRNEGWSRVPGTQLARYVFESPPFQRATVPTSVRANVSKPTVARYAIRSAVLPRMHETLFVAERLRATAMSQSKRVSGNAKPVFSGHGESGPVSGHRHAMYLASNENPKRGFIDHVVIRAAAGFDEDDVIALQRIRRLWGKGGHDLELVLVGLGHAADFGGWAPPRSSLLARSTVWESVTPFIPTRHPKMVRGEEKDGIAEQLARACEQLLGIAPSAVHPFEGDRDWREFRRRRFKGGGHRGPDRAVGARLEFDRPVTGPIALGYGAHFGLGLFHAVEAMPTTNP